MPYNFNLFKELWSFWSSLSQLLQKSSLKTRKKWKISFDQTKISLETKELMKTALRILGIHSVNFTLSFSGTLSSFRQAQWYVFVLNSLKNSPEKYWKSPLLLKIIWSKNSPPLILSKTLLLELFFRNKLFYHWKTGWITNKITKTTPYVNSYRRK